MDDWGGPDSGWAQEAFEDAMFEKDGTYAAMDAAESREELEDEKEEWRHDRG